MEPPYPDDETLPALVETALDADRREHAPADLAEAWRRFAEGRSVLVAIARAAGRQVVVLGAPARAEGLSIRQSRIVAMLCAGASLKQIAMELGKGQPTVSKHVRDAVQRLRVPSHVALANALAPWAACRRPGAAPPGDARESAVRFADRSYAVVGFDAPGAGYVPALTPAERAVADLVTRGLSNHAIARARHRSPRTIANQLARTFDKLGVHSRIELVLALGAR